MIDFHCHLDLYPRPADVVTEVARRGTYVLAVTTTPRAFDGNVRFVGRHERIRVAVGLHPELVKERHHEVGLLCSTMRKTRYVGEVGLDGSPEHRSSMGLQLAVLRAVLATCREEGGKVISLHSRQAATSVLDEIEAAGNVGITVLHWFSGSDDELARADLAGCWFSVGPAMLASQSGRLLAARMPADRLLPETDGPLGRIDGQPLKPWEGELVADEFSRFWGTSRQHVIRIFRDNLRRLVS